MTFLCATEAKTWVTLARVSESNVIEKHALLLFASFGIFSLMTNSIFDLRANFLDNDGNDLTNVS